MERAPRLQWLSRAHAGHGACTTRRSALHPRRSVGPHQHNKPAAATEHPSPHTRARIADPCAVLGMPTYPQIWSVATQKFAFTLSGHQNWVRCCHVSPDGRLAVSGGDDRTVKIWDLNSKKVVRSFEDQVGCGQGRLPWLWGQCLWQGPPSHAILRGQGPRNAR